MSYFEGFVIAVPTANRDRFIAHATLSDAVFIDQGALRIVECWQADVPRGEYNDFFGAVAAEPDESVVFSWIEWPDKATHTAMNLRMEELMKSDERFDPEKNPMPFDGKRMIHGTFERIVEFGEHLDGSYVQGVLIPVPEGNREAYRKMAVDVWEVFHDHGALRVVEAWQDEVPAGQQTDFFRAVKAEPGEKVVFSFMEWPSREVCDAAHARMQSDERMQMQPGREPPFDGRRMVFGGFTPVVDLSQPLVLGE